MSVHRFRVRQLTQRTFPNATSNPTFPQESQVVFWSHLYIPTMHPNRDKLNPSRASRHPPISRTFDLLRELAPDPFLPLDIDAILVDHSALHLVASIGC